MKKFFSRLSPMLLGVGLSLNIFAVGNFTELDERGNPTYVKFEDGSTDRKISGTGVEVLKQVLPLKESDTYEVYRQGTDSKGFQHQKFQQYYNGIKVEFATYNVHYMNGKPIIANGDFVPVNEGTSTTPGITEDLALQKALTHIGAKSYKWQIAEEEAFIKAESGDNNATFYPKAELVFVEDYYNGTGVKLAYKFDIYAQEPISRGHVYVDAQDGRVLFVNPLIHHADALGTAATRYSGTRQITTNNTGTNYTTSESGNRSVQTYNMKKTTNYGSATLFADNDNNWTDAEYNNTAKDNAGLDAHWGAEVVWDYWDQVHNRNSYNGNGAIIKSYVHYGSNYENAFWDGSRMTYGDGATSFWPLTSLDVCAHEIGHGVCTNTANLTYQGESGALNEALSDIWGACAEHFAAPEKEKWQIGEEIDKRSGHNGLRSMSNPNSEDQPDTYKGAKWVSTGSWVDNGGVHTNSGVMNFWFYLLSEGGSGTNDKGFAYSVTGIGIEKAELITFRAEDVYMTSSTKFLNARTYTIQAAEDLYGVGSDEACAVKNAWYAVWVGEACGGSGSTCAAATGVTVSSIANTTATVNFTLASGVTSYAVQISTNGSTWTQKATGTTSPMAISGLTACTAYQVRIISTCASGSGTSSIATFTTTGCSSACGQVKGVAVSNLTTTGATVTWTPQTGVDEYEVAYKRNNVTTFTKKIVANTANSYNITGLSQGANYTVKVRSKCAGVWKTYSTAVGFSTPATLSIQSLGSVSGQELNAITLYPSPATTNLNVEYTGKTMKNAHLSIIDVTGRVVFTQQLQLEDGQLVNIDLKGLSNGVYVINVEGGENIITERFVIAK